MDPDLELVQALGSEDRATRQAALAELYDRHQRRVVTVAYRVLGNLAAAEDVAQDVFLHLERSVRSFRGDASFRSWIYRITVNRAIDSRRRDARRPTVRLPEPSGRLEVQPPRGAPTPMTPPRALDRSDEARQVQAALGKLSPKLRAVAVLRYVEGLSYQELAEVLGCEMGTVKSRLNRAHTALKRELGPSFPGLARRRGTEDA